MEFLKLKRANTIARRFNTSIGALAGVLLVTAGGSAVKAQETSTAAKLEAPIEVELNKLEDVAGGCRAYVLVINQSDLSIDTLMLEMFSFKTDGVIGQRFSVEHGPLSPKRRKVNIFRLESKCDQIGSFLINDVLKCAGANGPIDGCMANLAVRTLTKAEIMK